MDYAVRMTLKFSTPKDGEGKFRIFTRTTLIPALSKADANEMVELLWELPVLSNYSDKTCQRTFEVVALFKHIINGNKLLTLQLTQDDIDTLIADLRVMGGWRVPEDEEKSVVD